MATQHSPDSDEDKKPPKSSLDILNPKPSTFAEAPPKSKTAIFLEELTISIVKLLNDRDFDHALILTHVDDNFTAYMEHTTEPYVTTRKTFIDGYRAMNERFPGYSFEVRDIDASVDEKKDAALVWFSLKIWGCPEGTEKESMTVGMWKRHKGMWVCTRQNGVRGIRGYV